VFFEPIRRLPRSSARLEKLYVALDPIRALYLCLPARPRQRDCGKLLHLLPVEPAHSAWTRPRRLSEVYTLRAAVVARLQPGDIRIFISTTATPRETSRPFLRPKPTGPHLIVIGAAKIGGNPMAASGKAEQDVLSVSYQKRHPSKGAPMIMPCCA
jgi:hypothetical protein